MSAIPIVDDAYRAWPELVRLARHHVQLYEAALKHKWATDHMDLSAQQAFLASGTVCPFVHPTLKRGLLRLRENHAKAMAPPATASQ